MAIGVRPIGTRGYGDNTGDAGVSGVGTDTRSVSGARIRVRAGVITLDTAGDVRAVSGARARLRAGAITHQTIATMEAARVRLRAGAVQVLENIPPIVPGEGESDVGYQLVIVDRTGARQQEIIDVEVERVTRELNGIGQADFVIGTVDPRVVSDFVTLTKEVQVWRNRALYHWGVPARVSGGPDKLKVQAPAVPWYLTRVLVGQPRTNRLSNVSFQSNGPGSGVTPTSWTISNVDTWGIVTNNALHDTKALQLNNFPGINGYAWQRYTTPARDQDFYGLGHLYVDDATWTGPAFEFRGLWLGRYRTSDDRLLEVQNVPIDWNTKHDRWLTYVTEPMTTDADVDNYFELRIYSPGGFVVWDYCTIIEDEALEYQNQDYSTIIDGLATHAQDAAVGKTSFNISRNIAPTGSRTSVRYPYDEHTNVWDAIVDLTEDTNGPNVKMVYDPVGGTRTLTTFTAGTTHSKLVLEFGKNLADFELVDDAQDTASRIFLVGDGSGPPRAEVEDSDTTNTDGLVLEGVVPAGPGAHIGILFRIRTRYIDWYDSVVRHLKVTTYDWATSEIIDTVDVGDVVPVRISRGWVSISGNYTVVKTQWNPKPDTLDLWLEAV